MTYDRAMDTYDLLVIGGGSGGVRAARLAAQHGAKVAVAESARIGGTCVNLGCVPKKLFVYASHFREEFEDAAGYGWSASEPRFDWPTLLRNKDRQIARLNEVYRGLLEKAGVRILPTCARLTGDHEADLGDRRIRAQTILIATGGHPVVPDIPGQELGIVSDHAFHLDQLPRSILIVGGGYIAVEFAGIFHGLGVRVTQAYRGPLFLRGFDDDLRTSLAQQMKHKGIDLRFNLDVVGLRREGGEGGGGGGGGGGEGEGITADFSDTTGQTFDRVMFATGRRPNTQGLGLREIGVRTDEQGAIVVDEYSRTTVPNIYAVGDVTNRRNLTPVALAEAGAFVKTVYADQPTPMHYENIPSAVFAQPPLATVGLSESQARRSYPKVDIYRSSFSPLKHSLSGRDEKTVMKLVVDGATGRIVGAHMLGPDAPEIIQGVAIALQCGATKARFDATIGIHPTAAEEFVTMRAQSG